ncbi:hypothetical protein Pmani_029364 [Petrolisthes manimaculis]|uniref:Uncharacterized protein n=1 Tax=Petrolisthes manimaculis TaxID=1843537 RepID=A0AAE1NCC5_9EUCA|nr:hypothetical protein Pmani_040130 [Petrolisthes manimaculis]KAK4298279.1 hypothetical protein Pmani_029364 [Petrolisthes manimaculis]
MVYLGQNGLVAPISSPGRWPQPRFSLTWRFALAPDTWPLDCHAISPPWPLTSCKFFRPVMQCQHHPLTWFCPLAEAVSQGVALGATCERLGNG